MKKILDFSWGDTRGVREVILNIYRGLGLTSMPLDSFGYPPHEGDPDLVILLKSLTKELTGIGYNHITVSEGCTHAVMASIYALKNNNTKTVKTRSLYYPRYSDMISISNLAHEKKHENTISEDDIALIDSPSNPLGLVGSSKSYPKLIWDGAYHSPTYGILRGTNAIKDARIFCGSLSKLTGINGLRLGWTATNEVGLDISIQKYIRNTICGVSYPSMHVATKILSDRQNLKEFFLRSKILIEDNKDIVKKLDNLFGKQPISPKGMFAFWQTDEKLRKLLDKAMVKVTPGADCGGDESQVRINLGNSNKMTKEMVSRITNIDKIAPKKRKSNAG